MTALVVLPDELIAEPELRRALRLCRWKFGDIAIEADPASVDIYRALFPDEVIGPHDAADRDTALRYPTAVYVTSKARSIVTHAGIERRIYGYSAYPYCNVGKGAGPFSIFAPKTLDEVDFPDKNTHIFNRLGTKTVGLQNFPFGVLYIDPTMGPIDQFGFRNKIDFTSLIGRPADHKVVALFGGSSAYSCACFYDEMFAVKLQALLNQRAAARGEAGQWTVLNFGANDSVVTQEMLTYLLFADRLKPEFVISHSGRNDLWYGLVCDPALVADHKLIYQRFSERWSQMLHQTEDQPVPDQLTSTVGALELNLPHQVVSAYLTRWRQFKSIAERQGATFITGLQPIIASKGKRSFYEQKSWDVCFGTSEWIATFFRTLFNVYDMLQKELRRQPDHCLVDFHEHFRAFDENAFFFVDDVHCTPDGDAEIARRYAEAIGATIERRA